MYESTVFEGVAFKPLSDEALLGDGDPHELVAYANEKGLTIEEAARDYILRSAPGWRNDCLVFDEEEFAWRRADDREWAVHADYCIEYLTDRLRQLIADRASA